jgi:hypothetical protein
MWGQMMDETNRSVHQFTGNMTGTPYQHSHDSSVGIVPGYGLDNWGSSPGRDWEIFSSPPHPDWL